MSETPRPARVIPPGVTLKRELDARGWSQKDFAAILQRPEQAISEIVNGDKRITPETALSFASAFGTSAEFWLNLQSNYELRQAQQVRSTAAVDPIRRKARLYERAPIAELTRRGWIKKASTLDALEREVLRFLKLRTLDEPCRFAASFKHSDAFSPERAAQTAWLMRVDAVATKSPGSRPFKRATFKAALPELLSFAETEKAAPKALDWLAERGLAIAVVKHLSKTFTDGVAYWRDDATPVVALSLRYDRIDSFWFTVLHEVAHIVLGHKGTHLDDLSQREALPPDEKAANAFAEELLLPSGNFEKWVAAFPRPRRADILAFAKEIRRAPGLVVGRLHHRRVLHFSRYRDLLVPVSDHLGDWYSV